MTDLKSSAHRESIKAGQWQVDKRADPILQELESPDERFRLVHIRALDG
jgi:hypothetical protein